MIETAINVERESEVVAQLGLDAVGIAQATPGETVASEATLGEIDVASVTRVGAPEQSLYPQARDYLDVYETHGLLGARGVYGHAIHLNGRERDRLAEHGAGLAHCPTSNTFIGSGLFDLAGLAGAGQATGLATDTGGGSSYSMLRTMAAAYEIAQLRGTAVHPAALLWLATEGAAQVLHRADEIGRIAPGFAADLTVLDLASTPAIAQRHARAQDIWDAVFPTIMMGDDRAIAEVWVGGSRRGGN